MPRAKKGAAKSPKTKSKVQNLTNPVRKESQLKPLFKTVNGVRSYLIKVNGREDYWTASTLEIAIKRNQGNEGAKGYKQINLEIPEGSPYQVPDYLRS